jgi:hypothetical protein
LENYNKVTMNSEEWNHYIETGEVPRDFLNEIIDKIKSGGTLSLEHLAVYQTHSYLIEILLKKKPKN